jgi:hypothetical protein
VIPVSYDDFVCDDFVYDDFVCDDFVYGLSPFAQEHCRAHNPQMNVQVALDG